MDSMLGHCASRSEFLPEFARPQRDACRSDFLADRPLALRRRARRVLRHDVNRSPPADPDRRRVELLQKLQGLPSVGRAAQGSAMTGTEM